MGAPCVAEAATLAALLLPGAPAAQGDAGIELHPAYVDVVVTRWQNFTGQTATLEETGEAFESKGVSA